ncbi:MAG: hypothetical protein K1X92_09210 [Bacteroidia bacterium]|nr:hypothetical protein [Bacteroidia bacterium]
MQTTILKIVFCFLLFWVYSCGNNTTPPTPPTSNISCRLLKLNGNDFYYDSNHQLVKVEQPNYTVSYVYLNNTIKEKYKDKFDPDSLELIHTINSNGVITNSTVSYSTFNLFSNATYSYNSNGYLINVAQSSTSQNSIIEFTYNNDNITFVKVTRTPTSGNVEIYDFQVENYNNFYNRANFSDLIVKGQYVSSLFLITTNLFGKSVKKAVKTTECCGQNFVYTVDSDSSILNGTSSSNGWGDIDEFSRVCD